MSNQGKEKKKILLFAVAMIALLAVGSTFAFLDLKVEKTNYLTAHTTDVEVKENFPEDAQTGGQVTKEVEFTNSGSSSVFLRMSFVEYWQIGEGENASLLSNEAGGKEVTVKNWNENFDPNREYGDWMPEEDGWYYYKKVLKAGASTGKVLDSVDFQNFSTADYQAYKDATYHLYFRTEVVQCSDGAGTLNKDTVNTDATKLLFSKTGIIGADGNSVSWKE